jgi:homoserine O-acetyltransferase
MQVHRERDFCLSSGHVLPEAISAYRTLGRLNSAGDNAVLITHGYTTGPAMLDPGANVAEGSWSELVGPGKPVDTARYFVVCPNMLGSCYGSTGPGSIDPLTGKPYGLNFPRIVMADIVMLQKRMLDALGVTRLAAVAGPSFGGYQAFQWGVSHPGFVQRLVAAVSAPWHPASAGTVAAVESQLASLGAAPLEGMTALRAATLRRYGMSEGVEPLAREWAEGFVPESLLTLMQAAASFDLRPQLAAIRAPVLMALSRTDPVFPPSLMNEIGPLLREAGVRWRHVELDSERGHFASGADAQLWAGALQEFLEAAP